MDNLTGINNPKIGHNPLAGGFEVLEDANDEEYGELELDCLRYGSEGEIGLNLDGGLKAFARSAWREGTRLLLPQPLHAAVLGGLGLGGRTSNISPFGVVDATYDFTVQNTACDPGSEEQTFTAGQPIDTCNDGCFPEFRISNGEGSESGTLTATLIPVNGSTSTLSGTTSEPTSGEGDIAVFDNLIVSASGTYYLIFAAPDAEPYVTGTFQVGTTLTALSCSQEGTIKSLNSDTGVSITFSNQTEQSVSVYWLNFDGLRQNPFVLEGDGMGVPYAVLEPGTSYVQGTFLTHPWILIGDDETCYGIFLPASDGGSVVVP